MSPYAREFISFKKKLKKIPFLRKDSRGVFFGVFLALSMYYYSYMYVHVHVRIIHGFTRG